MVCNCEFLAILQRLQWEWPSLVEIRTCNIANIVSPVKYAIETSVYLVVRRA